MAGRPKKEDSRDKQYRVRLNEEENQKLEYVSRLTGKQKSEIFRCALVEYYQKVRVDEMVSSYEEWEIDRVSLKRVVDCPYCNKANGIDFSNCYSESSDGDREMGEEITYSFNVNDCKCKVCEKTFGVAGFICEYPPGIYNYEEINVYKIG